MTVVSKDRPGQSVLESYVRKRPEMLLSGQLEESRLPASSSPGGKGRAEEEGQQPRPDQPDRRVRALQGLRGRRYGLRGRLNRPGARVAD